MRTFDLRIRKKSVSAVYSITSSARASTVGGISRPSALAVLRLMTSSYLVGACTGRSAGFSPREHDGHGAGRPLQCLNAWGARSQNGVWRKCHKLLGISVKAIDVGHCPAIV